jgi:hypothetical protein
MSEADRSAELVVHIANRAGRSHDLADAKTKQRQ